MATTGAPSGDIAQLLKRVHQVLLDLDASAPASPELSRVIATFESAVPSRDLLPTTVASLPQEILARIAELIAIPRALGRSAHAAEDDEEGDSETPKRRTEALAASFKSLATSLLKLAVSLVPLLPIPSDPPERSTLEGLSRLFIACSKFNQPAFTVWFGDPLNRSLSNHLVGIAAPPGHPSLRLAVLSHVLRSSLPTRFRPHPKLNPSTGRVLNRPLGGPNGGIFGGEDDGEWRHEVGLSGTVLTVIERLEMEEFEDLWPWLLPPVLSFLDDHDTENKILGLHLVATLLDRLSGVPGSRPSTLLARTGVGRVFQQSLSAIFSNLSDPLSVKLQSLAQPISLTLINLLYPAPPRAPSAGAQARTSDSNVTEEQSQTRFDALCRHFSETSLQTWQYKSGHYELELLQLALPTRVWSDGDSGTRTATATAVGIVAWMEEIGTGVVRYLGILIPHLTRLLAGDDEGEGGRAARDVVKTSLEMVELRSGAAGVLRELTRRDRARTRVRGWDDDVASAVARCWVQLRREEEDAPGETGQVDPARTAREGLKAQLQALVRDWTDIGAREPDKDLWKELKELDPIFVDLFCPVGSRTRC